MTGIVQTDQTLIEDAYVYFYINDATLDYDVQTDFFFYIDTSKLV